jgi:hypothetical protein
MERSKIPEPQWHAAAAVVPFVLAPRMGARRDFAAAASVVVDLDHFVDVAYHRLTGDRARQIIPLHAIELLPLLPVRRSSTARGVALGLAVHFCTDLVFGDYTLPRLSITWRISRRMRTGEMGDWAKWPRGPDSWPAMFGLSPERRRT